MSKPVTLKSNRDDSNRFDDFKLICSFLANSQVNKKHVVHFERIFLVDIDYIKCKI